MRSVCRMDAAQGFERGMEGVHRMCTTGMQALAGEHKAKSLESKGLAFFVLNPKQPRNNRRGCWGVKKSVGPGGHCLKAHLQDCME